MLEVSQETGVMPDERGRESRLFNPDLAPAALVALVTLGLLAYFTGPICPDVSGQFWLAHAMRKGSRLYTDLVEINPPLWFWMAMPIDWLGETLRMRTEPLTILAAAAWALLSITASRTLLAKHDPRPLTLFLLYMAVILLVVPIHHIEQREHLALIGAVPYLVLASPRRQGASVSPPIAVLIGTAAALGLSLKPHFLTVPILVEAWLLSSLRSKWRPIRWETVALAGTGALYLLAMILFTPRFLTEVVPRLYQVYAASSPRFYMAVGSLPFVWLAMGLGLHSYWARIRAGEAPLTTAFLLGFVGFGFSWAMQHMGWLYQGLPATACLALALAAAMMELGKPAGSLRILPPLLLLWPFAFVLDSGEKPITPRNDLTPAFAGLKSGDAFGFISTIGVTTWPTTVDRGLVNASRYGQYWMVTPFDLHHDDPLMRQVMGEAIQNTVLDFRCRPPKVIVFTRFDRPNRWHHVFDDPYRLFIRHRSFAQLLSHYRLTKRYGIFDVYEPAKPLPPVDRRLCRRIN